MTRYASRREQGAIAPRPTSSRSSRPGRRTFARLVGAVAMVTLTALLFWLLTDESFSVAEGDVTFEGLRHADETQVRAYLSDLERAPNVFRVRASDLVSRLSELTEVDAAYATVTLPANVTITLDEREPLFIWSNREVEWLVDESGMRFAPADDATRTEVDPARVTGRSELPLVEDLRPATMPTEVGSYLGRTDLHVMRHLLAITPQLLDSESQRLRLYVDQNDGYVLESLDGAWDAVFGHYTPSAQPPAVIARQVQCLRWTLASREDLLERAWLAVSDEGCGTIRLRDQKRDAQD